MAEAVKREKYEKLVQFPKVSDSSHFTMSEEELQKMIRDIAAAAQKSRKRKPKHIVSIRRMDAENPHQLIRFVRKKISGNWLVTWVLLEIPNSSCEIKQFLFLAVVSAFVAAIC